jgi:hypothetical protein
LNWNPSTGATSYDVYFGTSSTPPLVTNVTTTNYIPGRLGPATAYYWQIAARNSGSTGTSPIWPFTTLLVASPVIPVTTFNGGTNQGVFLYDPVAGAGYTGLSNGSGLFTYVYNPFSPGFDAIRYGDFNGDGKTDLIAYNVHPLKATFCSAMATERSALSRCFSDRGSTRSRQAT